MPIVSDAPNDFDHTKCDSSTYGGFDRLQALFGFSDHM